VNSKVLTYITNWNRVFDDVVLKESNLKDNGLDCVVVNSATEQKDHWLNIGDKWCYRQLFEIFKDALTRSDVEYFSVLFGDIYAPDGTDYSYFVKETTELVNTLPDCYVYSTSFTHDGWSYPGTVLKPYSNEVSFVCGTDTLYMTLHRDVVQFCADFLDYFDQKFGIDNFRSGWAVDVISSLYSIYNGKNVFRNHKSTLVHYENSGYDVSIAYNEMAKILDEAVFYLNLSRGYDVARLKNIQSMMFDQRTSGRYSYKDFYGTE
jgi:hypothetical protein